MDTITPVIPGLEVYEVKIGGPEVNQPQYEGLPALRSPDGLVVSRWTLTAEERQAVANGQDLYLSVFTFNHPFQPVKLQVGAPPAEDFRREMRLDADLELRMLLAEARDSKAALEARQIAVLNGNSKLRELAEKAQRALTTLEKKKAEIFSAQPPEKKLIEVVQ